MENRSGFDADACKLEKLLACVVYRMGTSRADSPSEIWEKAIAVVDYASSRNILDRKQKILDENIR